MGFLDAAELETSHITDDDDNDDNDGDVDR